MSFTIKCPPTTPTLIELQEAAGSIYLVASHEGHSQKILRINPNGTIRLLVMSRNISKDMGLSTSDEDSLITLTDAV